MDFIYMLECENWLRNIKAVWDQWHAYWLCQMNDLYHKIPKEYFNDWKFQIEYCYWKFKGWTKFYGSTRIIKGQYCANYVKDRFIIQ